MSIIEQEREIKKELRASMNGILSARMREAGMPFRLIFGVELPRLQGIASEFPQDAGLAKHLWEQNIRETRLLAIMLMPPEAFTSDVSAFWSETVQTAEEAQVMAMFLLPKTSGAKDICMTWLKAGKPLPCVLACLCLRHLLLQGLSLSVEERQTVGDCMARLLPTANLHLRKAIRALDDAFQAL